MAALIIKGLSKAFEAKAILRDIDLDVPSGSLVAILGASGSGKTTLLRLVAGFERADAGVIRIGGRDVAAPGLHVRPERRAVGYVSQEGALFPYLSVAENITFGLARRERRTARRVPELLDMVGLPADFSRRPPHELSGGEQQRVALARALAPEPSLVLLDEPFSALDTALRAETRSAVAKALAVAGTTAILVTHDQPEALSLGNPVAVLREGRLIQVATPRDLYGHPADADLARFVGEAVLLPGLAKNGRVHCALGHLDLATGMREGTVEVLIRPEQIQFATAAVEGGFPARVDALEFFGRDASIHLSLRDRPDVKVMARVAGFKAPRQGDVVWLIVDGRVVCYPR